MDEDKIKQEVFDELAEALHSHAAKRLKGLMPKDEDEDDEGPSQPKGGVAILLEKK